MQAFTGSEYLYIDIANHAGHDKLTFDERIQWTKDHLNEPDKHVPHDKAAPRYIKAVMALEELNQMLPSGHLVGLDASCSGVQIMSALTGDRAGAEATGLVNPNKRADAYSDLNHEMNHILHDEGIQVGVPREDSKKAFMTSLYGSVKEPIKLFGEDSPELAAFYKASQKIAPGACALLQDLVGSWQPFALSHEWVLPDGFHCKVKVIEKKETRIEVDELDKASFTYQYRVNEGKRRGVANAANVIHSLDAYVLRQIHRRCNYNPYVLNRVMEHLESALSNPVEPNPEDILCPTVTKYLELWKQHQIADPVIFPYLDEADTASLPKAMVKALYGIAQMMCKHRPFSVVAIHDEFMCHPNYMNYLRDHYRNILADLCDSNVLTAIFQKLLNLDCEYVKENFDPELSTLIRASNYALC